MPGSALPVLPAALRRTQAPIYAGERRPLSRPAPSTASSWLLF